MESGNFTETELHTEKKALLPELDLPFAGIIYSIP